MLIINGTQDLQAKLRHFNEQKQQIEKDMTNLDKPPMGTVDIALHRMKKQKTILQEQITRLKSQLMPDIIA